VLETHAFERLGGTMPIRSDFRLVAATHQNLKQMVEAGRFREDLYFRVNVLVIDLPPLRDRAGDVPLLARAFAAQFPAADGTIKEFTPEALAAMERYPWPGNVRELRNVVERLAVIVPRRQIRPEDLPEEIRQAAGVRAVAATGGAAAPAGGGVRPMTDLERDAIVGALSAFGGVKKQAAKALGIGIRTLYRKMKEYGIAEAGKPAGGPTGGSAP